MVPRAVELLKGVPGSFERFGTRLDAAWIDEALEAHGHATIRRRKLPAQQAVWLVTGMGLFRDSAISEVVEHLGLVLPKDSQPQSIGSGGTTEARKRLGKEPLEAIFARSAQAWDDEAGGQWHGLRVYALDGTTLRVADTEANRKEFKLPATGQRRAGYPQVRLLSLLNVDTYLMRAAAFGPCEGKQSGEMSLAKQLWSQVPEHSLLLMDKYFLNYALLYQLQRERDRHWLLRLRANIKPTHVRDLSDGSQLVELNLDGRVRKSDPSLPKRLQARLIPYQLRGLEPQRLLTSLLDERAYPAQELVECYHQRWEIELSFDELKTDMLNREEALRCQSPNLVAQELWGLLIAYNLVRCEIRRTAHSAHVPPAQISFRHAWHLVRLFCLLFAWTAVPGNLPKRLLRLQQDIALLILPKRRKRSYPRQVKIKISPYKRNLGKPASEETRTNP